MNFLFSGLVRTVTIFIIILIVNSCGTMIHRTELKQDYNFASKGKIGVYIIPSERPDLDEIYSSVLQLDFLSRGYTVKDLNIIIHLHMLQL